MCPCTRTSPILCTTDATMWTWRPCSWSPTRFYAAGATRWRPSSNDVPACTLGLQALPVPWAPGMSHTRGGGLVKIAGTHYRTIWPLATGAVRVIDQSRLPFEFTTIDLATLGDGAR